MCRSSQEYEGSRFAEIPRFVRVMWWSAGAAVGYTSRNKRAGRREVVLESFWSQVDRSGDCWIWQGAIHSRDWQYGSLSVLGRGKRFLAHRFIWMVLHGPIPEGLYVCHACDNPKCVNPEHLWLGSPRENTRDMVRKGRDGWERKLTAEKVREIRLRHSEGETGASLARRFGIAECTVGRVIRRKAWAHVV